MADAYLRENPPARSQYRAGRRKEPTGLVVVHTAESALDLIGADSGAENVARFIRSRSDPGSYHDIVDSDSRITLVRYSDEAFQDGTGSNPFALSISFACRAADWPRMTHARREAFLRQGAAAFAQQQAWLKANGHPLTLLRQVTRAQSDAGASGLIGHGTRDPDRRSDPGDFQWARFMELCAEAANPVIAPPTDQQEDTVLRAIHDVNTGRVGIVGPNFFRHVPTGEELRALQAGGLVQPVADDVNGVEWDRIRLAVLSSEKL